MVVSRAIVSKWVLTSGLELQARREAKAAKEQAALAAKALAELEAALADERNAKVT